MPRRRTDRNPAGQGLPNAPAPGAAPPAAGYRMVPVGRAPQRLEANRYKPGLVILLTIVTLGVWGAIWSYRTNEDLQRYNGEGLGGVLAVVIYLLLSPVLMFTIPNEIDKMYQRDGRKSPESALLGLWFLLPLIGEIIWYLKVQRALNQFWMSKGAQPAF